MAGRTHEQFVAEVYDLVGNEYTVLGVYKNNSTKILLRHNICGLEYEVRPNSFLSGVRCSQCLKKSRTKTHAQFSQEVYDLVGEEYTVLGEYQGCKKKILMRHNECKNNYLVAPGKFLYGGRRCPECHKNKRKTSEQFKQEVYTLTGDEYTVLGEYKNNRTKILFQHEACGNFFESTPHDFLMGSRCSECYGSKRKTTEQFRQEVYDLVGEEYTVLRDYIDAKTKILLRHNECMLVFRVTPHNFLRGSRCPRCNRSKGELLIEKILKKSHVPYVSEYSFPGSRYRYDFAVFKQPGSHDNGINTSLSAHKARRDDKPVLLIEFDGQQHFEPVEAWGGEEALKETQRRDRAKNRLVEKNNVSLLRIKYDDFDLATEMGTKSLQEKILFTIENVISNRT